MVKRCLSLIAAIILGVCFTGCAGGITVSGGTNIENTERIMVKDNGFGKNVGDDAYQYYVAVHCDGREYYVISDATNVFAEKFAGYFSDMKEWGLYPPGDIKWDEVNDICIEIFYNDGVLGKDLEKNGDKEVKSAVCVLNADGNKAFINGHIYGMCDKQIQLVMWYIAELLQKR